MIQTDKEINRLIDRYISGDISETEQRQLIESIRQTDNPEIPDGLEERLAGIIDKLASEGHARQIKKARIIRYRWPYLSIAASLAIILTLGIHFLNHGPEIRINTLHDTFSTPEEAYPEVEKALLILSSSIGKGMRHIEIIDAKASDINLKVSSQLDKYLLNKQL